MRLWEEHHEICSRELHSPRWRSASAPRRGAKPSRSASCCRSPASTPTSATPQIKGFDLYLKLHAKDLEPYKLDIVKRDEGPPSGANAKTVATELITLDKVKLIAGVVFSPSAIAMAPVVTQAKMPFLISNAGTAWITNLSPYIVAVLVQHVAPGLSDGHVRGEDLGCKTAAMGYTDFPPGKDSTDAFKTGFETGRRQDRRLNPHGQSGAGARTSRRSSSA